MLILFDNPTLTIVSLVAWGIVIALGLIIEVETTELVAIWFSAGAIPALICSAFETPIYVQLLVFAVVSLVLILITRPLVKKFNIKNTIPTNTDKLIGMIGRVVKEVSINEKGTIYVNYLEWAAITKSTRILKVGEDVVIKEIIGNKLSVEPIEEIEIK